VNEQSFYSTIFKTQFGNDIEVSSVSPVAGGCINKTSRVKTNQGDFFVKVNSIEQQDLFTKEEKGLGLLRKYSSINIPASFDVGTFDGKTYLILEWIENGIQNDDFWHAFGQRLAQQHRISNSKFGLDHDNHIGKLPQTNTEHNNWSDFFIQERLQPQIRLAQNSGVIDHGVLDKFELLFSKLSSLIPNEPPALLHGDLWSGNFLCGLGSVPFIFDPAVYFGHRETEMAFTSLFGGFDPKFYDAYSEVFPLAPGFDSRIDIHNLYPLLVHVNLFGPSYLGGIIQTLNKFC
jgi:fructosamine-3-kinase